MPEGWVLWQRTGVTDANELARSESPRATPDSPEVASLAALQDENARLRAELDAMRTKPADDGILTLNDEAVLQRVGIYRYHHPLENAAAYRDRLQDLQTKLADSVRAGEAIEASNLFTYDNSLAKGRRMVSDLGKLMLRAYNAEADTCLRTLRAGALETAIGRLERSRAAIAKLGRMMDMHISDAFHHLRVMELELAADFSMKKQEEKEAAREERARLREERKVERELQEERQRLEKEREHLRSALATMAAGGDDNADLQARLCELEEAIEQNDFRTANIRAGYVYVISNQGAFGRGVVKIGLTRRLEPRERVHELGGASVPFRFDVHGLFFSEDAVALETKLHQRFQDRRVNAANPRKEFFFVKPAEVRDALEAEMGALLEFHEHAESSEYLQSKSTWPPEHRRSDALSPPS